VPYLRRGRTQRNCLEKRMTQPQANIRLLYDPIATAPIEELEPLAQCISGLDPEYDVEVLRYAQRGPGPEVQVLQVYLDIAANAGAVALILRHVVAWLRKHLASRKSSNDGSAESGQVREFDSPRHDDPEEIFGVILGPDGKLLKSVRVYSSGAQTEDITPDDPRRKPHSPGAD
jgi:hypothetical protein